jgi:predicted Abi (CAAX) family protease
LQTLVIELQELLREDCYGREDWHNAAALRRNLQPDDPFDKLIMVA